MVGHTAVVVIQEKTAGGGGFQTAAALGPDVVDAAVVAQAIRPFGGALAEHAVKGLAVGLLEELVLIVGGVDDVGIALGAGLDVEVATDDGSGDVGAVARVGPGGQRVELLRKAVVPPAEMGREDVDQAEVRHFDLAQHGLAGVDVVDVLARGDVAAAGVTERETAEDGYALTVAVKAQVGPVGVQMVLAVETLADDLGGVGVPVALAVVPVFAHFLQANQVDVEFVDGAGDLGELVVLVGFLVGVQVEREHLEVGMAGAVVAAAIVVPAFAGGRGAADGILDAVGIADAQAGGPDLHAVLVGVAGDALLGLVPVVAGVDAGGALLGAPAVVAPLDEDLLRRQAGAERPRRRSASSGRPGGAADSRRGAGRCLRPGAGRRRPGR